MFQVEIKYKTKPSALLTLAEDEARQTVERLSKTIGGAEGVTKVLAWEL